MLAARLANATSPAAADLRRFDELYDADLIGVEQLHGEVESQMVEFRKGASRRAKRFRRAVQPAGAAIGDRL